MAKQRTEDDIVSDAGFTTDAIRRGLALHLADQHLADNLGVGPFDELHHFADYSSQGLLLPAL